MSGTTLRNLMGRRILVLDGAMGTMIQRRGLGEDDFRGDVFNDYSGHLQGNNDILSITAPEVIFDIHKKYLDAGADIITTNSFNANTYSQEAHGLEDHVVEICRAAADIARKAVDASGRGFVAGCLGPTGKTCSISPDISDPGKRDVTFDGMFDAYLEAATALLEGGVDLILIETVFDTINCKAAIRAVEEARAATGRDVPMMISATVADASGRTLSGQTVEAFLVSVSHAENLLSVGLNCSLGAEGMRPRLEELSAVSPFPVSVHPNAGLPDEFGKYTQSPAEMANFIAEFAESGLVNIVGGCCGTTPEHIAEIAKAVEGATPRRLPPPPDHCRLSGLEPLSIRPEMNFVNIGERTNVAGSRKFLRLIKEDDYEAAAAVARSQVENGARIIDINLDDGMIDGKPAMARFLDVIGSDPAISRVPVMLDSSDFEIVREGLKHLQGRGVVNSISLKEGEKAFLKRAAEVKRMGAAVLVMAFDEKGQADTFDRRIEVCERAYRLLVDKAGYQPHDIVLDPNVFAIATGMPEHDSHAKNFIDAVAEIKKRCPGALISGGISNVSFSFRGNNYIRGAIHAVFLYHAIANGLDMGIVNPAHLVVYDEIPEDLRKIVEDAVLNRHPGAAEALMAAAEKFSGMDGAGKAEDPEWRNASPEERISHAMLKGNDEFIVEDVEECRKSLPSAVKVIEGPLMDAMRHIGELFGEGKMFLPQVVKSARVMRKAVDYLTPFIEKERGGESKPNGKVLLATVKGDVHDIGKNIVAVVLKCDNIEVVDLGVMVPCDAILDAAEREGVDMVGLSGLITPSLEEMGRVAAEMERRNMDIPLLIGGAATSETHTAAKIAPNRRCGVCVHASDASKAVSIVNTLLDPESRVGFLKELERSRAKAADARETRAASRKIVPLATARENKLRIDWDKEPPPLPRKPGIETFSPSISELTPFIDWRPFLKVWELKGRFPKALDQSIDAGEEMAKVLADARNLLKTLESDGRLKAEGVAGIFPANSHSDDIVVRPGDNREIVVPTMRQQIEKQGGAPHLALADFIAPEGIDDHLGMFVVTAGIGSREISEEFAERGDDYSAIMVMALADRLAEAFAEYLHAVVRKELWAYAPDENLTAKEILQRKYQGIRPAPGYPACPDHSGKKIIFDLLDAEAATSAELTESSAMEPPATVAGFYFAHPESDYFSISVIGPDQLEDLARRHRKPESAVAEHLGAVTVKR